MDITHFKQDLLTAARILVSQGLADAFAHLSVRLAEESRILFMPSKSPALLKEEDLFMLGLEEKASQSSIHTAIYRQRRDVGAVIHTHSPKVITLSVLGRTVEPIHNYSAVFYEGVPLYERVGQVENRERAEEIVRALGQGKAMVLKGHGAVVVGHTLQEACLLAIFLEESSRYFLDALTCGEPQKLSSDEAQQVAAHTFKSSSVERGWNHYKALALRQFPL